ncbi:MAG: tRNA pseudouridine(38-40) synthase TruA [Parvularculaceae bacterium]|nr:tRNA pseudouridine(38-40) synthase TruA [Parvularculaceae bacterium]
MPQRYKLLLEFDGAPFVGWQRQDNGLSIQAAIESAVHALSGETVVAFAAGRTDAGVHALAMPAQFDLERAFKPDVVRDALNAHLRPLPIAVLSAEIVDGAFHVRYSATMRRYLYRIMNRRPPLALDAGRAWQLAAPLDHALMDAAASRLVGKHDFTTFRAVQCQARSPVKSLTSLSVARSGPFIEIRAAAPSFLHHQVRSMVGTLVQAGLGRWTADDVAAALEARDRTRCGQVAPAEGLFFVSADYGEAQT